MGTPPEPALDVYAMGSTAYACLSGSPPFAGTSVEEMLAAHLFAPSPKISGPGVEVPAAVDAVLARATAKNPGDRHPTCGTFVAALRAATGTGQRLPTASSGRPVASFDPTLPPDLIPGRPGRARRPGRPGRPGRARRARRARRSGRRAIAIAVGVTVLVSIAALVTRDPAGIPVETVATATPLAPKIDALTLDGAGNLYVATLDDDRVQRVTPTGTITTIAGGVGEGFSGDGGPATAAQLHAPQGLAVDPEGNLYIADTYNHRIRKVDPAGTITTIAGNGSQRSAGDGGPAIQAEFRYPVDVALDDTGNLYVAEAEGARIRRIDRGGRISTVAGTGDQGDSGDGGPAIQAQFTFALSIAVDASGNLYIADNTGSRVRRVDTAGTISTVAGNGEEGLDGDGGPATAAKVTPVAIAVAGAGGFFITSGSRDRKVDAAGVITTVAGTGDRGPSGDGGPAVNAQLTEVDAVAVGADGSVYLGDDFNHRIRRIDPAGIISTVAGSGPDYPGDGGPATRAYLSSPTFTYLDEAGRLYIADSGNHRIRRRDPDGTITSIAGNGARGFSGDGGPAVTAQLNSPLGVVVDAAGSLYIADTDNQRIRKVGTDGTITTIAGSGRREYSTDGIRATDADLATPIDLVVAGDGAILFTEAPTSRIRRIDPAGILTTIAGIGEPGFSGDGGPATQARLAWPYALHVADGALFFTDDDNHRVRKITPDGVISTGVGTGVAGFSGDGGPAAAAQLDKPRAVIVDGDGNLYVSDAGNHRVRKIDRAGVISTAAGSGAAGDLPDGPATGFRLQEPIGLAADPASMIYIADAGNDRICLLDRADTISTVAGARG